MTVLNINGKKFYPIGLFNRIEPNFEKFRMKYLAESIPQNTKNDNYYKAITHAIEHKDMYYAEYKYYKLLKNLT